MFDHVSFVALICANSSHLTRFYFQWWLIGTLFSSDQNIQIIFRIGDLQYFNKIRSNLDRISRNTIQSNNLAHSTPWTRPPTQPCNMWQPLVSQRLDKRHKHDTGMIPDIKMFVVGNGEKPCEASHLLFTRVTGDILSRRHRFLGIILHTGLSSIMVQQPTCDHPILLCLFQRFGPSCCKVIIKAIYGDLEM